jgi:Tfp pilus assembly protein PilN
MIWLKNHWGIFTSTLVGILTSLSFTYKAVAWQMNQDYFAENNRQRIVDIENLQFKQEAVADEIVGLKARQQAIKENQEDIKRSLEKQQDVMMDILKELRK